MDKYNELKEVFKSVLKYSEDGATKDLSIKGIELIDEMKADYKSMEDKLKGLENKEPTFLDIAEEVNIRKGF